MLKLGKHSFIILMALFAWTAYAQQSSFVKLNADGTLTYTSDEKGNTIPDFSAVGYRRSNVDLPNIPVVKIVSAAVSGSSQEIIQDAINEVAQMPLVNGFRGAILFKKGIYNIPDSIIVPASGIVLRGEGEDNAGTKWVATGAGQRTLLTFAGTGSRSNISSTRSDITDEFVPVGRFSFNVASVSGYSAGDQIVIVRPGTDQWIHDLKMDVIDDVNSPDAQWKASQYHLYFEREITEIAGNRIYIDNPVVQEMETKYGGGYIMKYNYPGRVRDVGVEYIRFESEYASNTDENHGWVAIRFKAAEHGWARNIIARYFGYAAVHISGDSKYITVKDSRCLDAKSKIEGSRRYSFNIAGRAQLNLVTGCHTTEGRHDYVTGARTGGPNVFHNSTAANAHADIGPHQRWAVGTLYDNISSDGVINVQDRGPGGGGGHGWAGVTQVLWNCSSDKRISVQSPWVSGKNYAIAVQGTKSAGSFYTNRPDGEWELRNSSVTPSSLFEAQLNARRATLAIGAKLNSFIAELRSGAIQVSWASIEEQNIAFFQLMHSKDNIAYTVIATAAASNNNAGNGYTYQHADISSGINYYKLRVNGTSGDTELPYIISVTGTSTEDHILFSQDFNQGAFPVDYINASDDGSVFFTNLGTTAGTTDNQATFAISDNKAVLGKIISGNTRGYAYLMKKNFNPNNADLLCLKFDISLNYTGNNSNSVFQFLMGKNFTEDGLINTESGKSFSRVTFNGFGGGTPTKFRVRANASSDAATTYEGYQSLRIYVNTSTETKRYTGLDHQTHTLPPKNYNVWVGTIKQKFSGSENIEASNLSTLPLQDFKLILTGGQPSTLEVDNIEITELPATLPVKLVSFIAVPKQNTIQLQWQTVSEQNNSHFEVLRAGDNQSFASIGRHKGMENSLSLNTYYFTDNLPLAGTNYYKLRQTDFSGITEDFGPLAIKYQFGQPALKAFFTADGSLSIEFEAMEQGIANLYISDVLGRKVYSQSLPLLHGTNYARVPEVIMAVSGIYIVSLLHQETRQLYQTKIFNNN